MEGEEEMEEKPDLLNQCHKMKGIARLLFYASQMPKVSKTVFLKNSECCLCNILCKKAK
jgi:hypothetical protein